eukprot:284319_1
MHLSTSFKYMCSAMTVLAYQTAALTDNTWKITYQDDAAVDFTQAPTDEITMTYEIGAGKTPTVNLYTDCSALVSGGTGTAITADLTTTDVTGIVTGDPLDTLTLKINIDKTLIDGSNIWKTGD